MGQLAGAVHKRRRLHTPISDTHQQKTPKANALGVLSYPAQTAPYRPHNTAHDSNQHTAHTPPHKLPTTKHPKRHRTPHKATNTPNKVITHTHTPKPPQTPHKTAQGTHPRPVNTGGTAKDHPRRRSDTPRLRVRTFPHLGLFLVGWVLWRIPRNRLS